MRIAHQILAIWRALFWSARVDADLADGPQVAEIDPARPELRQHRRDTRTVARRPARREHPSDAP